MLLLFYIQDSNGITLKIRQTLGEMAKIATVETNMSEAKRQNICCTYSFTFMHLADAHLEQHISSHMFYHYLYFLGIKPITLVLLMQYSISYGNNNLYKEIGYHILLCFYDKIIPVSDKNRQAAKSFIYKKLCFSESHKQNVKASKTDIKHTH